jgi:hypothetical protein
MIQVFRSAGKPFQKISQFTVVLKNGLQVWDNKIRADEGWC